MGKRKFIEKNCSVCGEIYVPTGPAQKRCAKPECKFGTRLCAQCGTEFYPRQRDNVQPFCSDFCARLGRRGTITSKRGQGSGRYFNSFSGYVWVRVPAGTEGAVKKAQTTSVILEHRLVAQQHLGRPLRRDETVHHINGNKQDNRWENLQVRTGKHGAGTVLACGDCGSRNVVHVPLA